ncbi:MAG: hypothetical protein M1272_04440 [Firmicutes bacterium]|nr:hypothetical protein [Bacillota bacterium]
MTSDTLLEHYYEFSMEGETLIPFIRRVLAGDYGVPERRPILHFLDTLEAIILGNIDARFEEGPGLEADPDAVAEETRREVDEARTLVMRTLPHD